MNRLVNIASEKKDNNPVYLLKTKEEIIEERNRLEINWVDDYYHNDRIEKLAIHCYRLFNKTLITIDKN